MGRLQDRRLPTLGVVRSVNRTRPDANGNVDLLPTGAVTLYGGSTAPAGWLLLDGSAVSRTDYAGLFAALGTAYGIGDGSTTFNLPDMRGRVPVGAGAGAGLTSRALAAKGGEENHLLTAAEMPAHAHTLNARNYVGGGAGTPASIGSGVNYVLSSTDSTASAGSGGAHNNMQPFLALNYIIKT